MLHKATSHRPALPLLAALLALGCDKAPEPDRGLRSSAERSAPVETAYVVPPLTSSAAAPPPEPKRSAPARVVVEAKAMGTHVQLAAYTSEAIDEAALKGKLEKAIAEIHRLEALMTTWRPDSEISRINAAAGKGAVAVSAETLAVIEKSVWMSERSEGVFDITFQAMHGLWKFDEDHVDAIPPAAAIDKARRL